ncbi:Uncharacterised protein [Mycobacterium tuberculosis]|nr:Uncharacterised protein [Mycobacterium tuberculosis]
MSQMIQWIIFVLTSLRHITLKENLPLLNNK